MLGGSGLQGAADDAGEGFGLDEEAVVGARR
jgi:hypothetical protein